MDVDRLVRHLLQTRLDNDGGDDDDVNGDIDDDDDDDDGDDVVCWLLNVPTTSQFIT